VPAACFDSFFIYIWLRFVSGCGPDRLCLYLPLFELGTGSCVHLVHGPPRIASSYLRSSRISSRRGTGTAISADPSNTHQR
jgi:hypothetical protein